VLADIKSFTRDELAAPFKSWNLPGYRLDQVLKWLYEKRAASWDAMTNLPEALRDQLAQHYSLHPLELVRKQGSRDTTQKFLWKLSDGAMIESVLIPANPALYGEASDRHTLCVSTQVGCAYGCKFCASGLEGWKRNLRVEEIIEQVLATERWNEANAERETRSAELNAVPAAEASTPAPRTTLPVPRLINNLVIMGMGEPLANYDNLLKALRILNAPWGGGIGARKITISTSGLAPQIRKLADAVMNSVYLYEVGFARGALENKKGRFDWTLGPGAQVLRERYGADYALLLGFEDSYTSAGRAAGMVFGALLGIGMTGGIQIGFAALIDTSSGRLAWFNFIVDGTGDLRNAKDAQAAVDKLLEKVPL